MPSEYLNSCTDGFFVCMARWTNDITSGAFWFMALISFMVIIFLATLRLGTTRAFGFASFVGLIGGVWLSILQLIPWWLGSTFIIVGVIGIVMMIISEN